MNVLITHECSGTVSAEFRALGHVVYSCDLKACEQGPRWHVQGDAIAAIKAGCPAGGPWHLIGMHPECRFLTVSGMHWNNRGRGWEKTYQALEHVKDCFDAALEAGARFYLENSIGIVSTEIRAPDQIIQPHEFGEDASKATCLWMHRLPLLQATHREDDFFCETPPAPRLIDGKARYANQTDSGQNKLAPSATRSADRAKTYPGIARAMAQQWGNLQP